MLNYETYQQQLLHPGFVISKIFGKWGDGAHSSISTSIEDFESTSCSQRLSACDHSLRTMNHTSPAWKRYELRIRCREHGVEV